MSPAIITIVAGVIAFMATLARLFFFFQGKKIQRIEDELDKAEDILDGQLRKKKREDILRRNPSLRKRLLDRHKSR